jgi:exonuclease SbcC
MMVLRLETLKLINFKTYQDSTLIFTPGHNVILGENGAGKSSIFEAVTYALFGSIPGRTIASLIRHDQNRMEVTLDFSINDESFTVERSATQSVSNALLREKDGKRIAEKAKAVNEEIGKKIGIGQRVFSNVVYIPQGQISAIASERPSERRELFDKILGYYLYKKTSDRLRVIEKSTEQSMSAINERLRDIKEDIKKKESIETDLEELENEMVRLQKDLVELEPKLKNNFDRFEKMNNEREKIDQIKERIRTRENEIQKRQESLIETTKLLEDSLKKPVTDDIKGILDLMKELELQLNHLEITIDKVDKKVEKGKKIKNILNELNKRRKDLIYQISEIESKKEKLTPKTKDQTEKEKSECLKLIKISQEHLTKVQSTLTSLKNQKMKEKELLNIIKTTKKKCPLCRQKMDDSHIKKIFKEKMKIIAEIDNQGKSLTKEKQKLKKEITRLEAKQVQLEEEEKKQIKVLENLKLLEEQAIDTRTRWDKIKGEIEDKENDFDYLELEENIKVLNQQKQDQKVLLNSIPRLGSIINDREELEKAIEQKNETIVELKSLSEEFDEKAYLKLKQKVEKLKAKKIEKETQIKTITKQQIPDKRKQLKEIQKKERKYKEVQNELRITTKKLDTIGLVRGFAKDIVPLLRRQHVLAISEYSSEIFSYLMNNEEYEGIEITDDYVLQILQSGKKYDLTILSGGEQVIACLAIRLAIAKLLANQDIMLLDEPTVMLDVYRRKELVEVFDRTKPVRQTIIVTHDTEFERVADTTFTIVKRAGKAHVISEEVDNIVSQQRKYQVLTQERFSQLEI